VNLLKINGLAWHVLKLANETEDALNFLDEWFMGLEGWSRWLISVVAPVLGITLTAIPCVVSCTKSMVSRIATNSLMEIDLGGEYVTMTTCRTCNIPMDVENYVDEIL